MASRLAHNGRTLLSINACLVLLIIAIIQWSTLQNTQNRENYYRWHNISEGELKTQSNREFIFETNSKMSLPPKLLNCTHSSKRLPSALIIGAKKCGTSSLMVFLTLHPHIHSPTREMHFFAKGFKFRQGYDIYRQWMPYSCPSDITIEKSPSYLTTAVVPERVHGMKPQMKLVMMVRNPVMRVLSDYAMYQRYDVERDAPKKLSLREMILTKEGAINQSCSIIQNSLYAKHLATWMKYYPRDQFLIINGDTFMNSNPSRELKQVEEFFGVPSFFNETMFTWNITKGFYCLTDYGCMPDAKGHTHETKDDDLMSLLKAFFSPYNKRFNELAGDDYHWDDSIHSSIMTI